jgi:hypothetical protein
MAPPKPSTYTEFVKSVRLLHLAGLGACALALAHCAPAAREQEPPARLLAAVWTDLTIPAQLDRLEAVLSQEGESVDAARPLDARGETQPVVLTLSLGFLDRRRSLDLLVVGRAGALVTVERRLRFARLPAGDSAVAVTLEARCAGRTCDADWTCIDGRCERPDVSATALAAAVDDLPADPLRALVRGARVEGCTTAADCEDGDPCTVDGCSGHLCYRERPPLCQPCSSDADCPAWGGPCLLPWCTPYGICDWRALRAGTRCDDDSDPCTVQCCREFGVCMGFDICTGPWSATGCDPDAP